MASTKPSYTEVTDCTRCSGLTTSGKRRRTVGAERQGLNNILSKTVYDDSQQKATLRLRSLDEDAQKKISQKYYGGFRPWMDNGTEPRG